MGNALVVLLGEEQCSVNHAAVLAAVVYGNYLIKRGFITVYGVFAGQCPDNPRVNVGNLIVDDLLRTDWGVCVTRPFSPDIWGAAGECKEAIRVARHNDDAIVLVCSPTYVVQVVKACKDELGPLRYLFWRVLGKIRYI